ncbi:TetR/AcrR family transcriptional regulator [bacterium]|nr:TetR/AcrR family transcriptional regulator [bacterium]
MSRPSQATDRKLIKAALDLVPKTGFSGLKLRQVAARAGVNLGMFHYHFKTKQEFLRQVMQEFYETFYLHFTLETSSETNPRNQLRKAIITLGRFVRDNRKLMLALGRDLMNNYQPLVRFMEENFHRHLSIIINLIKQCQKQEAMAKLPMPVLITFMLAGLVGPNIAAALLEGIRTKPSFEIMKKAIVPMIISDKAMGQRVDLALKALTGGYV